MLYLMPSRLLSPMFRNLTVLDGFVLVTTRFNFENWYKKKYDEHIPDKSQAEFLTDSYGVVHNQPVLVSLNTKYSPILISPEQRFEIVGKVLN